MTEHGNLRIVDAARMLMNRAWSRKPLCHLVFVVFFIL